MTNDAERVSDIVAIFRQRVTAYTKLLLDARPVTRAHLEGARNELRDATDIIEAQSKALAEARVVKPLEWGSEPPYLVARTRQGAHYSIEVMRDEDGNNSLIWTGGSFGSTTGKYLTVEAAKAAAQADHQQRILSALTTPTPENPNG